MIEVEVKESSKVEGKESIEEDGKESIKEDGEVSTKGEEKEWPKEEFNGESVKEWRSWMEGIKELLKKRGDKLGDGAKVVGFKIGIETLESSDVKAL